MCSFVAKSDRIELKGVYMKYFIFTIVILMLVALVFFVIAKGIDEDGWICVDGAWQKHGNPSAVAPIEGCSYSGIASESGNIVVMEPKANSVVEETFQVSGSARVFENQLNYKLLDDTGKIIDSGNVMANANEPSEFGEFEFKIDFVSPGGNGILEVFDYSAKDGSEIDKATIPVKFGQKQIVLKAFFANNKLDPEVSCVEVFPVERTINYRIDVARASIEELLKGTTAKEMESSYSTSINKDVVINSLSLDNGVARIDFNKQLEANIGGSCRVSLIRAQIEKTLLQFDTIQKVIISIDGRVEDILQP